MSLAKKAPKPIEYEFFVKVQCPHCIAGTKGKSVLITLPARTLPKAIRCFNCNQSIDVTNLYKTGKEIVCMEATASLNLKKRI